MTSNASERTAWVINDAAPRGVDALHNGILKGYSANTATNNLIVENIMMNDGRNNTECQCVIITQGTTTILRLSDRTFLYVAGEYPYTHAYRIANSTILQLIMFFRNSATYHSQ